MTVPAGVRIGGPFYTSLWPLGWGEHAEPAKEAAPEDDTRPDTDAE